jgi:hypothetical protein
MPLTVPEDPHFVLAARAEERAEFDHLVQERMKAEEVSVGVVRVDRRLNARAELRFISYETMHDNGWVSISILCVLSL